MNHTKWQKKFGHKDSRRYLKRSEPFYSDPYHLGSMPPPDRWEATAKGFVRRYPRNLAAQQEARNHPPSKVTTEGRGIWLATNLAQQEIDAVEAAIRETLALDWGQKTLELIRRVYWEGQNRKTAREALRISGGIARAWELQFLRAAAYNVGIHYNHTGRNRHGFSRRKNGHR